MMKYNEKNDESLNNIIKGLEEVLKKHLDDEKTKGLYERIIDLKRKRNID